MRYELGFSSPTPQVTTFLIIIIATYLAFALFGHSDVGRLLYHALLLDPDKVIYSCQLWRLGTYGVLHDTSSPMHVIFNALMLYMVGPQLEDYFGETKFFILIILSLVLGGVFVCLTYFLGISYAIVVGFSAATMGLIIAWGLTFKDSVMYIFGIVPLSGIQLVYVSVGLEILYAVSANSISSAAHFGGMFAGFLVAFDLYRPSGLLRLKRTIAKKRLR